MVFNAAERSEAKKFKENFGKACRNITFMQYSRIIRDYFTGKMNFFGIWKKFINGGQNLRQPPQIGCPPEDWLFLVKMEDCPPNGGHLVTLC